MKYRSKYVLYWLLSAKVAVKINRATPPPPPPVIGSTPPPPLSLQLAKTSVYMLHREKNDLVRGQDGGHSDGISLVERGEVWLGANPDEGAMSMGFF